MQQFTSSRSYQMRNGFSFAALTSTGAVLYWAGDGTMAVHSVVSSGATAATVSRYAVTALTSTGHVQAAGLEASTNGYEAYQAGSLTLVSIVGHESAFAGITGAGAVISFGAAGNEFAAQLNSGVISIVASAASFTVLKADGTVFTWGNQHCGGGVSSLTRTDLQGIVKVFATRTAYAGMTSTGKVLTWGDRNDGGDSSAVSAQLQSGVFHIVSSKSVFVAIKNDQSLAVWGNRWFGGDSSAVAAQLAAEVIFVAHTSAAFAALHTEGSVVTWGKAASGGDSSAVQQRLVSVQTIVGNSYAFAAITTQGAVVMWGNAAILSTNFTASALAHFCA
jgi:alpha-tubulin suppressor-like RCC1 family protein